MAPYRERLRRTVAAGLLLGTIARADPPLGAPTTHPTTGRSVTFGIENEFKPEGASQGLVDEGLMEVNLARVPFAYRQATIENRRGAASSMNLELNGLPVSSLDESMAQMRHVLREQGVDPSKPPPPKRQTGARSFHLHVFIPVEFFESLPAKDRTAAVAAFSARMSDVLMARRLAADPFFALSTESVGWLPPKFAEQAGATRLRNRPDIGVYDIEIRGARIDLPLLEELARNVVQVARDPARLLDPPADLQTALHLQAQTLPEFLETYGQKVSATDAELLRALRKATKGFGHELPLNRFDEIPLFAKQKAVIAAGNETFARNVASLLERLRRERQPLSAEAERRFLAEYRALVQRWGADVKLTELLGPKYLFPDPKELPPKAAQAEFLVKRAMKSFAVYEHYGELGRASIALDALAGSKDYKAHALLVENVLRGPNAAFRAGSARLLHGAPTGVLLRLIENTDGTVREGLFESLRHGDQPDRFEKLLPMLADPERRIGILNALRGVDGPGVVEAVVAVARLPGDSTTVLNARAAAYAALAGRSDPKSLAALKEGLEASPHSLAVAAAAAFQGRTDGEAIDVVHELLGRSPSNAHFYELIRGLKDSPHGEKLRNLYRAAMLSENEGARRGVAAALAFRSEPWTHGFLRSLATDPSILVRETLMRGLVDRYLDPKAVEILRLGLRDPAESVRRVALETLATRTDPASVALLRDVVVEQHGLMPNLSERPSLGPRLDAAEARRYIELVRAGRSLHGGCTDYLSVLSGQ